jgi:hypothetical protein
VRDSLHRIASIIRPLEEGAEADQPDPFSDSAASHSGFHSATRYADVGRDRDIFDYSFAEVSG